MDHPTKSVTFICTFQTSTNAYLRIPPGGGLLAAAPGSPDDYSTFRYFGEDGLIALKAFPDLYVGCTADKGLLTSVKQNAAVPFTMPQAAKRAEAISTMKGQMQATAGPYKNQIWYYLGAFDGNSNIKMVVKPTHPDAAIFTMTIVDTE